MSADEPDWKKLRELGEEIDRLIDAGKWTKVAYKRVLAEAEEAAKGHPEFIEFVVNKGSLAKG